MVATPANVIPTVTFTRHAAPSTWTPTERAELAARLAKVGTTITELSDVRERLGFPRLSESSDWDRAHAHENLESPEVQALLAQLRIERHEWLEMVYTCDRKAVSQARKLLGLRADRLLRMGELQALYAQARVIEIQAEQPRRIGPVTFHKVWTEEELFGGGE